MIFFYFASGNETYLEMIRNNTSGRYHGAEADAKCIKCTQCIPASVFLSPTLAVARISEARALVSKASAS